MRYKVKTTKISHKNPRIGYKVFEVLKDNTNTLKILTKGNILRTPIVKHHNKQEILMIKGGVYQSIYQETIPISKINMNILLKYKLHNGSKLLELIGRLCRLNMDISCCSITDDSYIPYFHIFTCISDAYQYLKSIKIKGKIYAIHKVEYYGKTTEMLENDNQVDCAEFIKIKQQVLIH